MSRPSARRHRTVALLTTVVTTWVGIPVTAQSRRGPASTTNTAVAQARQAPLVTFPADGIPIEEAVRLALENDPDIQSQREAVRFQEGVVQEQAGAFDATLVGTIAYDYRVTDLTSAAISAEQAERDSLAGSIGSIQKADATAQKTIDLLEQARNGPLDASALATLTQAAPSVAGTLANFDAVLAGISGASRNTLSQARTQFIDATEGPLKQSVAQGQQDLLVAQQQLNALGPTPTQQVSRDLNFGLQLAKPFRNGLVATPFVSGDLLATRFRDQTGSAEFNNGVVGNTDTLQAGVNVLVPLARGRGARAADALERASALDRDASQLTLEFQTTATALRTVLAYWELRGSQEAVGVARRSVELQTELLALTRRLIAAGELPQTDVTRAQAAESRSRAQLSDAQRLEYQARVALATAMGVATSGDEATLPRARDGFPELPSQADVQPSSVYLTEAMSRPDLSAASRHSQAGTVLVEGAETNLRPRVDLNGSLFFTSLGDTVQSRLVGPSETASLQIEKPIGNNLFAGQLAQRRADLSQRDIALTDLRRQIRLNVLGATGSLEDALESVRQAEAAVRFYQSTTDAEVQRFQIGEATLIDTVQTQQQQIDALLALVQARQQLAEITAQLRFQTGTLLQNGLVVRPNLIAVPGPPSK